MADLIAELPCGTEYPGTTNSTIVGCFIINSATLIVSLVTVSRIRQFRTTKDDDKTQTKEMRVLYYAHWAFFVATCLFSVLSIPISITQCYATGIPAAVHNIAWYLVQTVCRVLLSRLLVYCQIGPLHVQSAWSGRELTTFAKRFY